MSRFNLVKAITVIGLSLCAVNGFAQERDNLYLGAGTDITFNQFSITANSTVTGFTVSKDPTSTDLIGKIFAGYGYTAKNNLYLGGELGTNFPRRSASTQRPGVSLTAFTFTDHLYVQDYLTGDILPGYRIHPDWLVYTRFGVSYAHLKLNQSANSAAGTPEFNASDNKFGGRIGLGINYAMTKHLGAALDYYYTSYQDLSATWTAFNTHFKYQPKTNFVGLSINYSI